MSWDYAGYWDSHAGHVGPEYACTAMDYEQHKAYYMPILKQLAPPSVGQVLDYGCGAAMIVPSLRELWPYHKYIGLDISPVMIEHCKASYPLLEWHVITGPDNLPGEIDFLICHSVLTHITQKDGEALLEAIRDALAPNGYASVSIHTDSDDGFKGYIGRVDYEPAYFEAILTRCGLDILDYVDGIQRYYKVKRCYT